MITQPDYELAATKALELLCDNHITETPIDPLPILLQFPHVRVVPFAGIAVDAGMDREDLVPLFGINTDAATFNLNMDMDDVKYVVTYNLHLPHVVICRGIARELGHIVLHHDGATRTKEVRMEEAMCFAHNLLSPRPVIHLLQQSGIPLTMNVLASTTGCSYECVDGIQVIPPVHVPAELNRQARDLFAPHIREYIRFRRSSPASDHSPIVDLGTFMEGYEE